MDDDDEDMPALAYFTARDRLASDVRRGEVGMTPRAMVAHVQERGGFGGHQAALMVQRFRRDIVRHLTSPAPAPPSKTAKDRT